VGPAHDLEHLQLLLDRFRSHYNRERPHQGIGNRTPAERYLPGAAPTVPLGELALAEQSKRPPYPPHSATRKMWGLSGTRCLT
jgi:Integrase core domain